MQVREVERPLRTTFATSLGRKQRIHNVVITVVLEDGRSASAEVATSIAFKGETVPVIKEVAGEASRRLNGADIGDHDELVKSLRHRFPEARMTVSGIDTALFRASLVALGRGEHDHWGARECRLETDITIPFLADRSLMGAWVAYAVKKGFSTYKLKVSGRVEEDILALSALHEALRAHGRPFRLRLDGNQGYTVGTFLQLLGEIEKKGYAIELFEQPLRRDDVDGLARIRGRSPLPVLLDETVLSLDDARRVIDNGLCDGVNIKLAKSGIGESREILDYAKGKGMKVMIGCMMESMIGLSAAIFFAAGTGLFDFIDLDSVYFLYGQNRYPGIRVEGPEFVITSPFCRNGP